VHTKELKEMSALGAGYAALFLIEGTGLLFRKRWAEWLDYCCDKLIDAVGGV
jgi:uncharacterized membrane protein (DUF2068 family)